MANVRKVIHDSGVLAWRATIKTSEGKRRSKNFPRKGDADAWVKANDGASASGSASMTFLELARAHNQAFEKVVEAGDRDRRTADGYDTHLRIHLQGDQIAKARLSELKSPAIQAFLYRVADRASLETARRVKKSAVAWCNFGKARGWLTENPAQACAIHEKRRRRSGGKLKLPEKDQLAALLKAATEGPNPERDSAVLRLLMFGGMRISELLGLADEAVEVAKLTKGGVVHIEERLCSRYATLGHVKSEEGLRNVPIGPATASSVRAWRLARGPSVAFTFAGVRRAGRLFPGAPGPSRDRYGHVWPYQDFRRECWWPLMLRAGLGELVKDKAGSNRPQVAFSPHMLRHVYASIQIENGVQPKPLQKLLGHASLSMTMDTYGHLWKNPEADEALANAAEQSVLG
jgi:integrase